MPKRLPSTNYENIMMSGSPEQQHNDGSISIDLSNQEFTEEELQLLNNGNEVPAQK